MAAENWMEIYRSYTGEDLAGGGGFPDLSERMQSFVTFRHRCC